MAEAIAVDSVGNAYVTGQGSINTTLTPPASPSSGSTFVSLAKVGDPAGSPHIGYISPATAVVGSSGAKTVQLFGAGFASSAFVQVNGSNRATSLFVSATEVDATLLASDLTTAASIQLTVIHSGRAASNSAAFTIVNPPPSISSLSPNSGKRRRSRVYVDGERYRIPGRQCGVLEWDQPRTTTVVSFFHQGDGANPEYRHCVRRFRDGASECAVSRRWFVAGRGV